MIAAEWIVRMRDSHGGGSWRQRRAARAGRKAGGAGVSRRSDLPTINFTHAESLRQHNSVESGKDSVEPFSPSLAPLLKLGALTRRKKRIRAAPSAAS